MRFSGGRSERGTGSIRGVMLSVTEDAKSALVGSRPGIVAVDRKAASSWRWGGPWEVDRSPHLTWIAKKRDKSLLQRAGRGDFK